MNLEKYFRQHARNRLATLNGRTNEMPPHPASGFASRLGGLGFLLLISLTACPFALQFAAQGLSPETLLQPPTSSWPTYNGEYSGRRFSTLAHQFPKDQFSHAGLEIPSQRHDQIDTPGS